MASWTTSTKCVQGLRSSKFPKNLLWRFIGEFFCGKVERVSVDGSTFDKVPRCKNGLIWDSRPSDDNNDEIDEGINNELEKESDDESVASN